MARINTYPSTSGIELNDVFIIDGPRGTRTVGIDVIMENIPEKYVDEDDLKKAFGDESSGLADLDFSNAFPPIEE